jgi:enoyl-[acyl-carrier protein] reductase I
MTTPSLSSFHLAGKKGLVLGLANEHSIAWGCARQAQAMGAEVVASCLNDKARPFVAPLTEASGIDLQTCNIENAGELEALVAYAKAKLGRLDFVIHSLAWAPLQDLHGRVVDSSSVGFARAMEVSCHSFTLAVPHMTAGGSRSPLCWALMSEKQYVMGPVKAALESLALYGLELGPQGIRVHAVSPGPIPTRAASGIEAFDDLMQNNIQKSPLRRLVTLDEIANLSTFLCTDAASGMTGQTIYVDAGSHAVA